MPEGWARFGHRRICGFYCIIKRTHCPTVRNHGGVEVRTSQHVYQCSRVPKKEKKIRGGPMPYSAEPLKQWMSRLGKRHFGLYKLIMCGLMLVLCHMGALCWVSFCQCLLKKKGGLSDLWSGRDSIFDESFAAIQACVSVFCWFFLHVTEKCINSWNLRVWV